MDKKVLLDTSFFLRFLNENDKLFSNANHYYKKFLLEQYALVISTISIAEYCVKGKSDELPLKNLQILPFNFDHAIRAGELANVLFEARKNKDLNIDNRLIIPNDTKLFAQADIDKKIDYFVTSDIECIKAFNQLTKSKDINFQIIDIHSENSILSKDGQPKLF